MTRARASDEEQQYSYKYRRRIVELARSGQSPKELAKKFPPTEKMIRKWMENADWEDSLLNQKDSPSDDRRELARLRRKEKRLLMEIEILRKAQAWFSMRKDHADWKDPDPDSSRPSGETPD